MTDSDLSEDENRFDSVESNLPLNKQGSIISMNSDN